MGMSFAHDNNDKLFTAHFCGNGHYTRQWERQRLEPACESGLRVGWSDSETNRRMGSMSSVSDVNWANDILIFGLMKTKHPLLVNSSEFEHEWMRDVSKFTVQKAKKGIKRRCISLVGVQLWNNVKMDIRMVNSFLLFKRNISSVIETYVQYMEDVCGYIYI